MVYLNPDTKLSFTSSFSLESYSNLDLVLIYSSSSLLSLSFLSLLRSLSFSLPLSFDTSSFAAPKATFFLTRIQILRRLILTELSVLVLFVFITAAKEWKKNLKIVNHKQNSPYLIYTKGSFMQFSICIHKIECPKLKHKNKNISIINWIFRNEILYLPFTSVCHNLSNWVLPARIIKLNKIND